MAAKPSVNLDAITRHIHDNYGFTVLNVAVLALGADANAATYRADCVEGAYFLKLRGGPADDARDQLPGFLAGIAEGAIRALAPVLNRDGRPSTPFGDFHTVLYPFFDGRSGFESALSPRQWTELGAALRTLHGVELPAARRGTIRVESFSPKWREKARAHLAAVASGTSPKPIDAIALQMSEVLLSRHDQLSTVVARAEELAVAMLEKSWTFVLCHGDIHGGNVMLSEDGSLAVVDWDDPVFAPIERDLMYIGAGIGGVWNQPAELTAFYQGYGSDRPVDAHAIAYYRYERIMEDLALFCDELLTDGCDGDGDADGGGSGSGIGSEQERALSLRYFTAQFGPGEVIDIADRTYAAL